MKNRCKKCFFEHDRVCSKDFIGKRMIAVMPTKCTRALRDENKCGKLQKCFRSHLESETIVKEFEVSGGMA